MSDRSHSRTPPVERRPARGIRGGKSARRKREANLRYEQDQGRSLEEIPVSRPGGQQRPLGTTRHWDLEDPDSASETEVEEVEEIEEVAEEVEEIEEVAEEVEEIEVAEEVEEIEEVEVEETVPSTASSSRPRLTESVRFLRPTSKAAPSPSVGSREVICPPSSASSSRVVFRPSSSAASVSREVAHSTASSVRVPAEPVRRNVQVAESVQLFAVGQDHWKTPASSFPIRAETERIVAVDWHQVTDTCRLGERSVTRVSEDYRLPDRVLHFYQQVAAAKGPGDLLGESTSNRFDYHHGRAGLANCTRWLHSHHSVLDCFSWTTIRKLLKSGRITEEGFRTRSQGSVTSRFQGSRGHQIGLLLGIFKRIWTKSVT